MSGTVLVTGAGGFIGGHIVEFLLRQGRGEVIATSQGSGARFARYGVPFHAGNLMDPAFASELTRGVNSVIHCAFGPGADEPSALESFLTACEQNGVSRIVHMSTVEVYASHEGVVDETSPTRSEGTDYGAVKSRLEQIVRGRAASFHSVVILRPAIVYGPASTHWIIRPLKRMVQGGWRPDPSALPGTCNPVHVTDLARFAAAMAHDASPGVATFNVVGPETCSWGHYYGQLADRLPHVSSMNGPTRRSFARAAAAALARQVPRTLRRRILDHARSIPYLDLYSDAVRRTHLVGLDALEQELYRRRVTYATTALRRTEHAPRIHLMEGLDQTLQWASNMGLLGSLSSAHNLLTRGGA